MNRALLSSIIVATIVLSFWKSLADGIPKANVQKHKSEAEIINMTPAARVDEYVNEQVHHRFDLDDDHSVLIRKYVLRVGRRKASALTRLS